MSDAFKCERCEEYKDGSGEKLRFSQVDVLETSDVFANGEFCDDCKEKIVEEVKESMSPQNVRIP